jgi:hypothetical protein
LEKSGTEDSADSCGFQAVVLRAQDDVPVPVMPAEARVCGLGDKRPCLIRCLGDASELGLRGGCRVGIVGIPYASWLG